MTKITIELDDAVIARLAAASHAHRMTIEEWLRAQAEQAARASGDFVIENPAHRAILASLHRPDGYYASPRDEMHDRERDRAELYVENRAALLDLIDNTEGDMGAQAWNRRGLYEP